MGISLMSALMIQGNEVMVDTYGDKKTGYGFAVYLMKNKRVHTIIISTSPNFPYKSEEEASRGGETLIDSVRKMDLSPKKSALVETIGKEEAKVISKVVSGTRPQKE